MGNYEVNPISQESYIVGFELYIPKMWQTMITACLSETMNAWQDLENFGKFSEQNIIIESADILRS